MIVQPVPGFGVDRLADATNDAQGAEVGLLDVLFAESAEQTDSGGGGVEVGDLMPVNGLPEAGGRGVDRCRLEHGRGNTIGKRAVDDITVSKSAKLEAMYK